MVAASDSTIVFRGMANPPDEHAVATAILGPNSANSLAMMSTTEKYHFSFSASQWLRIFCDSNNLMLLIP